MLAATMVELERVGYGVLSVSAVAKRAAVHPTSVYRRWNTKRDLVFAACLQLAAAAIADRDCGALRRDLESLLHDVNAFLGSAAGAALVSAALETRTEPSHAEVLRRYWAARMAALDPIFDRARQRGELSKTSDSQEIVECLIGPLYVRRYLTHRTLSAKNIKMVVAMVLGTYGKTK